MAEPAWCRGTETMKGAWPSPPGGRVRAAAAQSASGAASPPRTDRSFTMCAAASGPGDESHAGGGQTGSLWFRGGRRRAAPGTPKPHSDLGGALGSSAPPTDLEAGPAASRGARLCTRAFPGVVPARWCPDMAHPGGSSQWEADERARQSLPEGAGSGCIRGPGSLSQEPLKKGGPPLGGRQVQIPHKERLPLASLPGLWAQ